MRSPNPELDCGSIAAGIAAAPVLPVLLLSVAVGGFYGFLAFPFVLVIGGYPPAIIVGVPVILIAARLVRLTPVVCAVLGAVIASPWMPLLVDSFAQGQHLFHKDKAVATVAALLTLGAMGGLVFWWVAVRTRQSA